MKTIHQGHSAQVALKMSGMLWAIDFCDCNTVGEVPGEGDGGLHIESRQFSMQHYRKLPSIPFSVGIDSPVSEIDVEIIECRSIVYGREDFRPRYLRRTRVDLFKSYGRDS